MSATVHNGAGFRVRPRDPWLVRQFDCKPFLIALCLLPTASLLIILLTYPLGLGVWLSLTSATIGEPGHYVGLHNFDSLFDDPVFWGAV